MIRNSMGSVGVGSGGGEECVALTLGALALQRADVRVVSVRRGNGKSLNVDDEMLLQDGDTLVLSGKPEGLAIAEQVLLQV